MKARRPLVAKFMTLVVGLALCGIPECAQAWPQDGGASPQNGQQQQQNGTTVDPSQGPLQPVPSQNQPNPLAAQPNQNTETAPEPLPATPAPRACRWLAGELRVQPERRLRQQSRVNAGRCS